MSDGGPSPDMYISRRREAKFLLFAENAPETVENDQTGLPWAAALTAQMQKVITEQLAARGRAVPCLFSIESRFTSYQPRTILRTR